LVSLEWWRTSDDIGKKALLAAVALLLSGGARLPAAPAAAPAEHANYMPNPGFEVVKDGWAEGWLKFHDPTSSTLELDERVKKSGKCAAHVSFLPNAPEKASRYSGMIRQFGGMFRPGSTYTYSAYVKTKGFRGTVWLEAQRYPDGQCRIHHPHDFRAERFPSRHAHRMAEQTTRILLVADL